MNPLADSLSKMLSAVKLYAFASTLSILLITYLSFLRIRTVVVSLKGIDIELQPIESIEFFHLSSIPSSYIAASHVKVK